MSREHELKQSGELRNTSNFTKGQMVAADYTITPTLIYSVNKSSGLGVLGYIGAPVVAATSAYNYLVKAVKNSKAQESTGAW